MSNINGRGELGEQDPAKKQVLFSSERHQKNGNNRAVSAQVEENEKAKNVNVPENREILAENRETLLLDYLMNKNILYPLNDRIVDYNIQDTSNILSNKEKYNIAFSENPNDVNQNPSNYIFIEIKDT